MTFDFGQTLVSLDHQMLASRVAERGIVLDAGRAEQATPGAWAAYNRAKRAGRVGEHAWMAFMRTLLVSSGVADARAGQLAVWLFSEQPTKNLWRKPVPGMFDLVRDLVTANTTVGAVSNSEGRLAELIEELGLGSLFRCVADSGRLGVEKPDAGIFEWAAERLDVPLADIVHVGDSWEADVKGALAVGARAIWFDADATSLPAPDANGRVWQCRNAGELRALFQAWNLL